MKVIIKKLQNEEALNEYSKLILEVGKEYELPIKGKCVFHDKYYQLEDNNGKELFEKTGFPVGKAIDSEKNMYYVGLDNTGIVLYLEVSEFGKIIKEYHRG